MEHTERRDDCNLRGIKKIETVGQRENNKKMVGRCELVV